ncbi:diguanylate cyclase domain-containing protein [Altericroceibacterium spongiae]|uniref:diguanylate cyclase domain-containing protein n=1 Tax=Altericroceibacterium spongiae TaxID=2320269 RepID=UPI001603B71F|nr:diguanylate cyclase [Altericroceibacterium spongiae]
MPAQSRRSFVTHIIIRLVAISFLGTVAMGGLAFAFLYQQVEQRELESLSDYVAERGGAESQLFLHAERDLDLFRQAFLQSYTDPEVLTDTQFSRYFAAPGDGTVRLKREYYTGYRDEDGIIHNSMTGFVAHEALPLDREQRRRFVLSYRMLDKLAPSWMTDFSDVHISLPEGALIAYWPGMPWGLEADSDMTLTDRAVVKTTSLANDPSRKPIWAGIYFDEAANDWTATYMLPIDAPDGRHLATVNADIALGALLRWITRKSENGEYSLILTDDGSVIAHPALMEKLKDASGEVNVKDLGDPVLLNIYTRLRQSDIPRNGEPLVLNDPDIDAYLGVTELTGTGWWLITVQPHTIMIGNVYRATWVLFLLITALAAMLILAVALVLRKSIAHPLNALKEASEHIADGNYDAVAQGHVPVPEQRDDEIGLLSRSFRNMAQRVGDASDELEKAVADRTRELEQANRKLSDLSLKDPLTDAFNRRAFDHDLALAAGTGSSTVLALFDVDHFKRYNDNYGHTAGDKALCRVVHTLKDTLPDARIYRYGGEEIAALLERETAEQAEEALFTATRIIADCAIPHRASPAGCITISGGMVPLALFKGDARAALQAVDHALYEAKQAGRNRLFRARIADPARPGGFPTP